MLRQPSLDNTGTVPTLSSLDANEKASSQQTNDDPETGGETASSNDNNEASDNNKDAERFPPTCYSLIARSRGVGVWFGHFVVAVQIGLIQCLYWGFEQTRGKQRFSEGVIFTQALASIGFVLFSEHALGEVSAATKMCPNPFNLEQIRGNKMLLWASFLRLFEGFWAVVTAASFIFGRDDAFLIVIAITTAETVARFDGIAFRLARAGRYAKWLRVAATEVETMAIPPFARPGTETRQWRNNLFRVSQVVIFAWFMNKLGRNIHYGRNAPAVVAKSIPPIFALRVDLPGSSGLGNYSGCYVLPNVFNNMTDSNEAYHLVPEDPNATATMPPIIKFGHCKEDHRWVLYRGEDDLGLDFVTDGQRSGGDTTAGAGPKAVENIEKELDASSGNEIRLPTTETPTKAPTEAPSDAPTQAHTQAEPCREDLWIAVLQKIDKSFGIGRGVPLDSSDLEVVSMNLWKTLRKKNSDQGSFETFYPIIEDADEECYARYWESSNTTTTDDNS